MAPVHFSALVGLLALPFSHAFAPAVRIPSAVAVRPALTAVRPAAHSQAPAVCAAPARCAEPRLSARSGPPKTGGSYVNVRLVSQLILSQSFVFTLASSLSNGAPYRVLAGNDWLASPDALLIGVIAMLPLLVLNKALESSESPILAPMNLSTDLLVLSMFGSRSQPAVAFLVSLFLCGVRQPRARARAPPNNAPLNKSFSVPHGHRVVIG
jgi:hypothetical protein